ncbi:MAG: hypothetical protein AB2693_15120 [Candidatus Thiodiazotropha sp.]
MTVGTLPNHKALILFANQVTCNAWQQLCRTSTQLIRWNYSNTSLKPAYFRLLCHNRPLILSAGMICLTDTVWPE